MYLKTSTSVLLERIQRRGRDFEQSIDKKYLETITKYYDIFFEGLQVILPNSELIVCETDQRNKKEVLTFVINELEKRKQI